MTDEFLSYNPAAALKILKREHVQHLEPELNNARQEVFDDLQLLRAGGAIPEQKQPLDAAFLDLPQRLLDEYESRRAESEVQRILEAAAFLREETDRVVLLGIGGSYMGTRALFEALCSPYHNELPREKRDGIPRLSFAGNNVDNDATTALLSLLKTQCRQPEEVEQRWGLIVISKSGGTLETAVAFRLFRQALEEYYGAGSEESQKYVVPVTGAEGKLRQLAAAKGYPRVFDVPEAVGGRFSVLSAVGLLPAAVLGLDIVRLLQGAAEMTEHFRQQPLENNPVLQYTAVCHLFEEEYHAVIRVLSTWGAKLESLGLWYDQLLAESLGKEERGATPLTTVNTRDLHSRGQQHQQGRRDKLITNVLVEQPSEPALPVPSFPDDEDDLNRLAGKTLPDILQAAFKGTNQAYAGDHRPTADILLPRLNEYTLGQLFQFFMLATVLEGRLIGINPYGQPGVEAYKNNMNRILQESPAT